MYTVWGAWLGDGKGEVSIGSHGKEFERLEMGVEHLPGLQEALCSVPSRTYTRHRGTPCAPGVGQSELHEVLSQKQKPNKVTILQKKRLSLKN